MLPVSWENAPQTKLQLLFASFYQSWGLPECNADYLSFLCTAFVHLHALMSSFYEIILLTVKLFIQCTVFPRVALVYNAFNAGELALGKAVFISSSEVPEILEFSWSFRWSERSTAPRVGLRRIRGANCRRTSTARRGGSRTGEPLPRMAHATCHRRHAVEKPLKMEQLDILGPNEIRKTVVWDKKLLESFGVYFLESPRLLYTRIVPHFGWIEKNDFEILTKTMVCTGNAFFNLWTSRGLRSWLFWGKIG